MKKLFMLILGMVLLGACASEENSDLGNGQTGNGKNYSADILLATPKGNGTDVTTRGLNTVAGEFTDEYPYSYIYLHRADDLAKEAGHQCIQIPLEDVIFCDDCQGIHLEMTVQDNDGGYIIKNRTGDQLTLGKDDEVYFSTIDDNYWKADIQSASPISNGHVFYQDNEVNKELLRSTISSEGTIMNHDYTKDDLIALLSQGEPEIPMTRHCTAFRVYFMFTKIGDANHGSLYGSEWNNLINETYNGGQFYIKLYMGPNFAEEYNVFADNVTDPDQEGYYVTNEQRYQPFELSEYAVTSGEGGLISFTGFGYTTSPGNFLISPLNKNIPADNFSVYAFIKFAPKRTVIDDDFLTSDVGAKWFKLQVPSMTLEPNRVHYVIMAIDVNNLKVFQQQSAGTITAKTRTDTNGPEEIKVNSVIVKDIVE